MKNSLNGLLGWTDARFPLTKMWKEHISEYYAPKNLNFWYFFGSLALLVLVNQILTGIWLTMSYKPDAELAFASVEFIMRDVEWGWLIRYLHSTGASAWRSPRADPGTDMSAAAATLSIRWRGLPCPRPDDNLPYHAAARSALSHRRLPA